MPKTKEEKAKRLVEHSKNPSLANLDMAESLERIADELEKPETAFPDKVPIEILGVEMITIKGDKGDKGDTGEKGERGDQGETGKDGKNGYTPIKGIDYFDGQKGEQGETGIGLPGQDGKDGSPDTGEQIVNKINDLPIDEDRFKIDVSHIKGLEKIEKDITNLKNRPISGGTLGRDLIKDIDISDQFDGVTKTFNIQAVWYIISVDLSSYPYGSLRKGTDYTWTPTSITFTDEIDASTQLSAGQKCILTVVVG